MLSARQRTSQSDVVGQREGTCRFHAMPANLEREVRLKLYQ